MDCENCPVNLTDCYYGCTIIEKYVEKRIKKYLSKMAEKITKSNKLKDIIGLMNDLQKEEWTLPQRVNLNKAYNEICACLEKE